MKSWRKILLIILGVVVLVVLLAPTLLSTGPVRVFILGKANAAMPGALTIDGWSFGWFSGQNITGLGYSDDEGRRVATVDKVTLSKGLLKLVLGPKNIGAITIQKPRVYAHLPAPSEEPAVGEPKKAAPPARPSKPTAPKEEVSFGLPDVRVELSVEDGSIFSVPPGQEPERVIENLKVVANVDGTKKPVKADVEFLTVGGGRFKTILNIEPPTDGPIEPERLEVDSALSIEQLDLGELSSLAASVPGMPAVSGTVNGTMILKGTLSDGLKLNGEIHAAAVEFSGGPFAEDTPSLGDVVLRVEGQAQGDTLSISTLTFRSDLASLTASGVYGGQAAGTVTARGVIDLAAVLNEFATTVGLQEGLTLTEGSLNLSGKVTSKPGQIGYDARAVLEPLKGVAEGKAITWDEPTELHVQGGWGDESKRLDALTLDGAFIQVDGQGDLEGIDLTAKIDMAGAINKAGQFVALQPWTANGEANLSIKATTQQDGAHDVRGSLVVSGLSVNRGTVSMVPESELTVSLSSSVVTGNEEEPAKLLQPAVSWQSWLSAGRVSAKDVTLPVGEALPIVNSGSLSANLDLAQLSVLLGAGDFLPEGVRFGGRTKATAELSTTAQRITVDSAAVTTEELLFEQGGNRLEDKLLTVSTAGSVDLEARRAAFPRIDVKMASGSIALTGLQVGDLDRPDETVSCAVTADVELSSLLQQLSGFAPLPEGLSIAGATKADLKLGTLETSRNIELNATIDDLRITSQDADPITDDQVVLAAVIEQAADGKEMTLDELRLQSAPLGLEASASFASGDSKVLHSKGTMALNLEVLASYVRAFTGAEIEMAGREEKPFSIDATWEGEGLANLLKNANISAGLHADLVRGFGLDIQSLDIPLSVSEAQARLAVRATVNEGTLEFEPSANFNEQPPVLTFPGQTNILTGVALTADLANGLLAKISPLFRQASDISGTLDLYMDHFNWPLDPSATQEATFAGRLDLKDVQMGTSGLLKKVMDLIKVKEQAIDIGNKEVDFVCRDGRIECSPMKIRVDEYHITIGGSVGLDQTLDYTVEVPVTRELVGGDVYTYLEGTTIRVPIGGTVSEPELGEHVLRTAVGDLVRQATQKQLKEKAGDALRKEAGKALEKLFQ